MSKKDDGRTKIGDDDTNGTIDLETLKRAREMMAFDETAFEEHDEPEGSVSKQPCLPKYAPIKLFATNTDKQKRSSCPLRQEHCMTLREMMGFDPQPSSAINWIMLTSYLIDFDYLLDEIPELLSVPKVVIFYGHGSPTSTWKKACTRPDGTCSVEFRQLNPSDPPNSASNPLGSRVSTGDALMRVVFGSV